MTEGALPDEGSRALLGLSERGAEAPEEKP